MDHTKLLDVEKYYEYKKFLIECSSKIYDESLVLHSHHIIPTHIEKNDDSKNLIKLSVEDHVKAHIMLAECFDKGSIENINNLRSARVLNKNSIKDVKTLKSISEAYKGEGNPFFGKTHSEENRILQGARNTERLKGKTYEQLYGDSAKIEKEKRKDAAKRDWDNKTEEQKKQISDAISKSLIGKLSGTKNPASFPILVDEVWYESTKSATETLNVSRYILYKKYKITKLKNPNYE